MKILVLSYEYPPIGGGGGVICKNISENLAGLGNQVTVLTAAIPESGNRYPVSGIRYSVKNNSAGSQKSTTHDFDRNPFSDNQESEVPDMKIIRLPSLRRNSFQSNPLEMLSWIRTTKKFILNNPGFVDFDICMAHFVLPGGEVAHWMKKKFGLPYVLISHGHEIPWVHPRQMFLFHLGAYFWIKKVCRHSFLIFVQTKIMKANIDSFLGRKKHEKNVIIPNGVDASTFYPDYSKRPARLRIIFTGRLVSQKDPMTFLKAIRMFQRETRDFEVHILGDGRLRKKMEQYVVKNKLAENIVFLGKMPEEKVIEEYQSAHLMVAPSLNEGMSISALEALSCGVYLIATRASGYEDMITENINGEIVAYSDPEGICEKLTSFYRQNKKESKSPETNLAGFKEPFTWEKITRKYIELLHGKLFT